MENKYWWTLKEVREIVFSNSIAAATLQKLVNEEKIPSNRFGTRKIFIPDWWVQEQLANGREGMNAS